MPNWCINNFRVTTDSSEESRVSLKNFLRENHPKTCEKFESEADRETSGELTFWGACPRPESEEENWYDWNIENWGTKWDISAELQVDNEDELCYQFDSAWGPPIAWFRKVAEKYTLLSFFIEYEEIGCDFWGILEYANGIETREEENDLSTKKYNDFIDSLDEGSDNFIYELYNEKFKGALHLVKEIAQTKNIHEILDTFIRDSDDESLPLWVNDVKEYCQEDWDYSYYQIMEYCINAVYEIAQKEYDNICKKEQEKVAIGIAMLVKDGKLINDIGFPIMEQLMKSQK